jgi:hypothetical protein
MHKRVTPYKHSNVYTPRGGRGADPRLCMGRERERRECDTELVCAERSEVRAQQKCGVCVW